MPSSRRWKTRRISAWKSTPGRLLGLPRKRGKPLAHGRHLRNRCPRTNGGHGFAQPDLRVQRNRDHPDRPQISRASASRSQDPPTRSRCAPARSTAIWPSVTERRSAPGRAGSTLQTGRKCGVSRIDRDDPRANRGSRGRFKIRLAFNRDRRAACAIGTPGAAVCRQIDRFSSSDQTASFAAPPATSSVEWPQRTLTDQPLLWQTGQSGRLRQTRDFEYPQPLAMARQQRFDEAQQDGAMPAPLHLRINSDRQQRRDPLGQPLRHQISHIWLAVQIPGQPDVSTFDVCRKERAISSSRSGVPQSAASTLLSQQCAPRMFRTTVWFRCAKPILASKGKRLAGGGPASRFARRHRGENPLVRITGVWRRRLNSH